MKIGIFDSGLGGLLITRAIRDALPEYDLVYLGDTLHVPYGRRSRETVYELTRAAVEYLFTTQDCHLVILACNTASATALRRLQQTWLAQHYPDRRVLGVVVPTLEKAIEGGNTKIGLLATEATVNAGVYEEELRKLNPDINIFPMAAPLLVPMIENHGMKYIAPVLQDYLSPIKQAGIQSLILGCTHYCRLTDMIAEYMGPEISLISQAEITPPSLKDYLSRHPEHDQKLSKHSAVQFLVTDITPGYSRGAIEAYGDNVDLQLVKY